MPRVRSGIPDELHSDDHRYTGHGVGERESKSNPTFPSLLCALADGGSPRVPFLSLHHSPCFHEDHVRTQEVAAGQEKFTCPICNASFRSGKALGSHAHREGMSHESLLRTSRHLDLVSLYSARVQERLWQQSCTITTLKPHSISTLTRAQHVASTPFIYTQRKAYMHVYH